MATELQFFTVNEAAVHWRISPATVRRLIASGRLKATRIGRSIRIERGPMDDSPTGSLTQKQEREVIRCRDQAARLRGRVRPPMSRDASEVGDAS